MQTTEIAKIEIPYNKFKISLGLLFFLVPLLFLSWNLFQFITEPHSQYSMSLYQVGFVIVAIFLCGLCCFFALKAIISNKPALVIDDRGIMVRNNFIPWCDIARIETMIKQYKSTNATYIVIFLTNPEQYIQSQTSRFNQFMLILTRRNLGSPIACSTSYLKCNFNELKNSLDSKFAIYGNHAQLPQTPTPSALPNKNYTEIQWEHVITKKDFRYIKKTYLGIVSLVLSLIFYMIFLNETSSLQTISWLAGPHHNVNMIILLILSILCFSIYTFRGGDSVVKKLLTQLPEKINYSVQLGDDGFIIKVNSNISQKYFYQDITNISVNALYVQISMRNQRENILFFSKNDQSNISRDELIGMLKQKIVVLPGASQKFLTLKRDTLLKAAFITIFGGYFASISLVDLVINSKDEVPQWEKSIALYTLETKANFGSASSQNNLGVLYLEGKVVQKDKERSKYWLEKAAAQNDQKAIHNLRLLD